MLYTKFIIIAKDFYKVDKILVDDIEIRINDTNQSFIFITEFKNIYNLILYPYGREIEYKYS